MFDTLILLFCKKSSVALGTKADFELEGIWYDDKKIDRKTF